jgi:Fe-S-cluster-containing dehydrogenase component/anaerobic selenocysteine-containing dehydrogenase
MTARSAPSDRTYWRTLDELGEMPEVAARIEREIARFGRGLGVIERRRFLQLMAASLALGGLSGCGPEPERRQLLPYVEEPPGIVPGQARAYATALTERGYANGVVVTHQTGRPVKIEGNPDHPASRGAATASMQASILTLYDPHRSQSMLHQGQITAWEAFATAIIERRGDWLKDHGVGLRVLSGTVTSPTLVAQIAALQQQFPAMRWHQWEPLDNDEALHAAQTAFGRPLDFTYDLSQAEIIFAIGSDLISTAPGHLAYARELMAKRRPTELGDSGMMSRIYAIESTPTLLGAKADHRLALNPAKTVRSLRHLAAALGAGPAEWRQGDAPHAAWLDAAAKDLQQHRGHSLVHLGSEQASELHLLGHAINGALDNFGATIRAMEPIVASPTSQRSTLADLIADMQAGKVDTLVIIGANPVYAAPADLDFAGALREVPLSVALSLYADETALAATWHVPMAHEYEAWSDARAFDGTVTIQQPQARPLYGGHSAHQLLAVFAGDTAPDDYTLLRTHWQQQAEQRGSADFEPFWHEALRLGIVANSAASAVTVTPKPDLAAGLPPLKEQSGGIALLFRPDEALGDGRHADNAWLLELPRPFTRLTWDNAALIAPETASRLGIATEDIVTIESGGRSLRAPIFVLPGQAQDCITLPLGFGRSGGGLSVGVGFDANSLRRADMPFLAAADAVTKTGDQFRLATVQGHDRIAGRDLVKDGSFDEFRRNPAFLASPHEEASLYPGFRYEGEAWAMAIDLTSCIGCQACVAACQAENNIPVVGKEQVLKGREMHWLRIDRYYTGAPDTPSIAFEPVPCMHCENAPCEVVCPVEATVHDSQGLNAMVYNRCIGTRFCSNNCPYKVRRFNFFGYAFAEDRPPQSWNPEVTVRDRGVMEKCTYCVQRIRQTQIAADREDRPIKDGEILTACQQSCPTEAIVFGDRNDLESRVAKRQKSPLDYVLLAELNTRPRTTYQALIRNPNPGIETR